jgi:hypothetical protein
VGGWCSSPEGQGRKIIFQMENIVLNKIENSEPNEINFFFLRFRHGFLSGRHCDYLPRAPQKLQYCMFLLRSAYYIGPCHLSRRLVAGFS